MNKQTNITSAKNIEWVGIRTTDLLWTGILTLLAIAAPSILAHTPQNQLLTGTIVNAILFLAAWKVGLLNAFAVAALPSTIALIRGLLPAPMAPLIPYIIISNLVLVLVFSLFKKRLLWGVATASFLKFGFLFSVTMFFASKINPAVLAMLQWPQLLTALLGGLAAVGFIKIIQGK